MRTTNSADQLSREEIIAGGEQLRAKVLRYRPGVLAVLGVGAYRTAFSRPKATIGRQEETIGDTVLWALPNPNGLHAYYQPAEIEARIRSRAHPVDRRLKQPAD